MSDQYNLHYTHQPHQQQQQQRPPSSWHQNSGRGGFRGGGFRGGFRGNARGFSRGRGRGRGGGVAGGHKQANFSDKLELDKTAPLDYSTETLEQHYKPYYSPLFSQDPWKTATNTSFS